MKQNAKVMAKEDILSSIDEKTIWVKKGEIGIAIHPIGDRMYIVKFENGRRIAVNPEILEIIIN